MTQTMETISELAARWAVRADAGALGPDEQRELDTWLAADSRHLGAYVRGRNGSISIAWRRCRVPLAALQEAPMSRNRWRINPLLSRPPRVQVSERDRKQELQPYPAGSCSPRELP